MTKKLDPDTVDYVLADLFERIEAASIVAKNATCPGERAISSAVYDALRYVAGYLLRGVAHGIKESTE